MRDFGKIIWRSCWRVRNLEDYGSDGEMHVNAHRHGPRCYRCDDDRPAINQFSGYQVRLKSGIEAQLDNVRFSWGAGGSVQAALYLGGTDFSMMAGWRWPLPARPLRVPSTRGQRIDAADANVLAPAGRIGASPLGQSGLLGSINVRHMCAVGLASLPSPSLGWRKWRPMMSVNGSIDQGNDLSKA
jgi:hypothetical protein